MVGISTRLFSPPRSIIFWRLFIIVAVGDSIESSACLMCLSVWYVFYRHVRVSKYSGCGWAFTGHCRGSLYLGVLLGYIWAMFFPCSQLGSSLVRVARFWPDVFVKLIDLGHITPVVVSLRFGHVIWVVGQPLGCFVGSLVVYHGYSGSAIFTNHIP